MRNGAPLKASPNNHSNHHTQQDRSASSKKSIEAVLSQKKVEQPIGRIHRYLSRSLRDDCYYSHVEGVTKMLVLQHWFLWITDWMRMLLLSRFAAEVAFNYMAVALVLERGGRSV